MGNYSSVSPFSAISFCMLMKNTQEQQPIAAVLGRYWIIGVFRVLEVLYLG